MCICISANLRGATTIGASPGDTHNLLAVSIIGLAVCGAVFLYSIVNQSNNSKKSEIRAWVYDTPTSADPLDYDAFVHHVAFRSVFSSIVSQYRRGEYIGILAERWTVSPDFKEWSFKIRGGLTFDDGSAITPQVIVKSLRRMAYIMGVKKSQSELFDGMIHYHSPKSLSEAIEGIEVVDDSIRFRFSKATPKLLETLSFGIYAILAPTDYDQVTGAYIAGKRPNASGAYSIKLWDDNGMTLSLREIFGPSIRHPNAAETVHLSWAPEDKLNSNLIVGFSTDDLTPNGFHFLGPTPSNIFYIHCLKWRDKKSPFSNKNYRQWIKSQIYNSFEGENFEIARSFFPPNMRGIQAAAKSAHPSLSKPTESPLVLKIGIRSTVMAAYPKIADYLTRAFQNLGIKAEIKKGISFAELGDNLDRRKTDLDLALVITGVLVEDPYNDIKFMFQSKEGIRLADEDGSVHALLENDNFEAQEIEEKVRDQAIMWPMGHPTMGIWIDRDIDSALLNALIPPTDFSWIGLYKKAK